MVYKHINTYVTKHADVETHQQDKALTKKLENTSFISRQIGDIVWRV